MSRHGIKNVATQSSQGSRPLQEDYVLASKDKGIFVVADGFGGGTTGAIAAKTACESVLGFLEREAGDLEATLPFILRSYYSLAGNVLFNSLIHANRVVTRHNHGKNIHEKGGASVLAGFMDGDLLALANVGACSAWLLRNGQAVELVIPRSYGRLCDPAAVDCPAALAVPLMAVGMVDDLEPEIVEYRMAPGDWLLLQTDGVDKNVRIQLQKIQVSGKADLDEAMKALKTASFTDNATCALIGF